VLRVSARNDQSSTTGNELIALSFNGTGGTAYSDTFVYGNGSTAASSRDSGNAASWLYWTNTNGTTASTFGSMEIYIPNYTGTSQKPISSVGMSETNGSSVFGGATAGLANITSAVTSLTLACGFGGTHNFVSGSSFYLYGI
jgi:hypothetical protein